MSRGGREEEYKVSRGEREAERKAGTRGQMQGEKEGEAAWRRGEGGAGRSKGLGVLRKRGGD